MAWLPDELWLHILQSGIRSGRLQHRDVCSLSIACTRLNRICGLDDAWKQLISVEFPEVGVGNGVAVSEWKALYITRFEKLKEKIRAAHRRQVIIATSSLSTLQKEKLLMQKQLQLERERLQLSRKELESLETASQCSVALQVWQPRAVTTRLEQVVQQMPVDVMARRRNLEMEIQVGRVHILVMGNALRHQKSLIETRQKELDSLLYRPTQSLTRAVLQKEKVEKNRTSSKRMRATVLTGGFQS